MSSKWCPVFRIYKDTLSMHLHRGKFLRLMDGGEATAVKFGTTFLKIIV